MHYELKIEHVIDNTYQVIDVFTGVVFYEGSYENCSLYKNQ
jgi:hypothetical protein